jgi:hypothetical protein
MKEKKKRLIYEIGGQGGAYGADAFPDAFQKTAEIIESSLIQAGATPGKDYTILDLYRLAQPFILHRYQRGELTDAGYDHKKFNK